MFLIIAGAITSAFCTGLLIDTAIKEEEERKETARENARLKSRLQYHEDTVTMSHMTKEDIRYQVASMSPYLAAVVARIYVNNNFRPSFAEVWINTIHAIAPGYKGITNLQEFKNAATFFDGKSLYDPHPSFNTVSKRREIKLALDSLISIASLQAENFMKRNPNYNSNMLARELDIFENEIMNIIERY